MTVKKTGEVTQRGTPFSLSKISVTSQAAMQVFHWPWQWRIQDFPLGGRRPIGGAPTSDAYTFWQKHMQK